MRSKRGVTVRTRGLLREYGQALSLVARLLDAVAIVLAGVVAHQARFGHWDPAPQYRIALVVAALLTLLFFPSFGLYRSWRARSVGEYLQRATLAWATIAGGLIVLATATKTGALFSRHWMWAWGVLGLVFLLAFHVALLYALRWIRARGFNRRRVLIIGTARHGRDLCERIEQAPWTGLDVAGIVATDANAPGAGTTGARLLPVPIERIGEWLATHPVDEIWITLPLRAEDRLQQILHELRHATADIRYFPDLFGFHLLNHAMTEVAGMPAIDLRVSPMTGISRALKTIEDGLLALIILVLTAPLMAVIAVGVKMSSPGPILFKQRRHGWDGRPIEVYKFRTMVMHNEANGTVTQARKDDPRVTAFGAFLRRTSLDELPQFFNVLQGRMSIVGPRPHALAHNEQYKELIPQYMLRHKVKPGITGWAQVNGWRGETDTLEKMAKRVELDLYYIENWSLWLDLKIILMTLFRAFNHPNAY